MKRSALLPLVLLALAGCSENPVAGPADVIPTRSPLADVISTSINPANAPSGTHYQAGTSAACQVNSLAIFCRSYELAGVGNSNARADLDVAYHAIVDCRNHGKQVVEVKAQAKTGPFTTGDLEPKNGRLLVPALSTGSNVPSESDFTASATCPNGNWTKEVRDGTITLGGFVYTLKMAGFPPSYITITGP